MERGPDPTLTPWYRAAFGRAYMTAYRSRDEEDARTLGRLLAAVCCPCRGRRVLDVGCGPGRHLGLLAGWEADVYGIDLSSALLSEARRRDPSERLAQADMRALPFRSGTFDLALFLFTTFGYFETDEENATVLRETRRVLRPGGRVIIDTLNPAHLRKDLVPESKRRVDSVDVLERRWFDESRGRVEKRVTLRDSVTGEVEEWTESVRLWSAPDLERLVGSSGFGRHSVVGSFDGERFSEDGSARIILVSEAVGR